MTESFAQRTEVWHGKQEIIKRGLKELSKTKIRYDSIVDHNGPSIIVNNEFVLKAYADIRNRGCDLRLITKISKANVLYSKKLAKILELRHFDGIKGNLGIVDGKRYGATARTQEGQFPTEYIHSTVKSFVEQQQYFFDMLWNKAIPAEQRIKEIEEGIKPDIIAAIRDPIKIEDQYIDLIKSATKEIMLIIPTMYVFYSQHDIGILKILNELAMDRSVNIRILSPLKDSVQQQQGDQEIEDILLPSPYVDLGNIGTSATKSIILVVHRKESLVIEVKDNLRNKFSEVIGFATYSNSRSTVLSYISIFESFWIQTEMYKKVKETEQMQKEFINTAAHELRNSIQPILSLTEIAERKTNDTEQKELLGIVLRNAKKLKQLTEDVLDVTRIESDSLHLDRDEFSLNDLVMQVIQDYENQIAAKLVYDSEQANSKDRVRIVHADKYRISQVISNLVSNSAKFTKEEGTIYIKIMTDDDNSKAITVSVKDTGTGIDPTMLPRLFTKFATKSNIGTGLGLFISKSIVEAHGGKIWAENNSDGKGATFYFSLPVSNN